MPSEDMGEMPPPPTPFYDDMEENVVDLASSSLMVMIIRKAVKTAYWPRSEGVHPLLPTQKECPRFQVRPLSAGRKCGF